MMAVPRFAPGEWLKDPAKIKLVASPLSPSESLSRRVLLHLSH